MTRSRTIVPPLVSVVMPAFDRARFVPRALDSLLAQEWSGWELLIVDDGSTDTTPHVVSPWVDGVRIRYERLERNRGLGAALNVGLDGTRAPLVAYLPSDDVMYPEHLASLVTCFDDPDVVLAFSGVRHHYNRTASGVVPGEQLQLVQAMHRRTDDRWIEREELVTDDLDRMFWDGLRRRGGTTGTGRVTAEWVDHPDQRHKVLREPLGGVNPYRARFGVTSPLRFHSTVGSPVDEVEQYRELRERPDTPAAAARLNIVVAGELAYNPERILALEERGHRLFGLWTPDPYWHNTVGPLPFGHVTDLPASRWRESLREHGGADVIYALLNWQAVPFVRRILDERGDLPLVWHFKEGPFICLEKGTWGDLVDLYEHADGLVYSSPEMRDWFETAVPSLAGRRPSFVLDGDLPKRDWFLGERSQRLSERDGQLHTVVPGRPIGLHPADVGALAAEGVHLHFYGDFLHGQWREWIERSASLAPDHLHLHPQVDQKDWLRELSQYDAGWLHYFESTNASEIRRATWDDLNYPARLATLLVSGLPVLQRDNTGAVVATQNLVRDRDVGLFFTSMGELAAGLRDERRMAELRSNVWRQRSDFTFDAHADELLGFFRTVIAAVDGEQARARGVAT